MLHASWLARVVLLLAGSSALLQAVETTRGREIAGLSLSNLAWGAVAALSLGCIAARRGGPGLVVRRDHCVLVLFLAWAVLRLAASGFDRTGLREVCLLALPIGVAVYAASCCRFDGRRSETLLHLLMASIALPIATYAIFLALGWVHLTRHGPFGIVGPRPVSLHALLVMSVSLAVWRFGENRRQRLAGAVTLLLGFALVLFTSSRMAGIVAFGLLMMFLLRVDATRFWKACLGTALTAALAGFLILEVPALQDRFFEGRSRSLVEALENLNFERRNVIWAELAANAAGAPLLGWGPGSSRRATGELFHWPEMPGFHAANGRLEFYPHNEYLLIFNDYGLVGLCLFGLGWTLVLRQHWKRWRHAGQRGDAAGARWNMAAFLCVGIALTTSLTDNTLHYMHVMAPVLLLSAQALALAARSDARAARRAERFADAWLAGRLRHEARPL